MSLPDLSSSSSIGPVAEKPRGVLVRRPRITVYMVLLGISFAAISFACLLLLLELWQYGPLWTSPWNVPVHLR